MWRTDQQAGGKPRECDVPEGKKSQMLPIQVRHSEDCLLNSAEITGYLTRSPLSGTGVGLRGNRRSITKDNIGYSLEDSYLVCNLLDVTLSQLLHFLSYKFPLLWKRKSNKDAVKIKLCKVQHILSI